MYKRLLAKSCKEHDKPRRGESLVGHTSEVSKATQEDSHGA